MSVSEHVDSLKTQAYGSLRWLSERSSKKGESEPRTGVNGAISHLLQGVHKALRILSASCAAISSIIPTPDASVHDVVSSLVQAAEIVAASLCDPVVRDVAISDVTFEVAIFFKSNDKGSPWFRSLLYSQIRYFVDCSRCEIIQSQLIGLHGVFSE